MNKIDENKNNKDIIAGRNPVTEALRSGRPIDCLYIARGELSGSVKVIAALAKEKHIPIKEVDRKKLDYMTAHSAHQGVAAAASMKEYASVSRRLLQHTELKKALTTLKNFSDLLFQRPFLPSMVSARKTVLQR